MEEKILQKLHQGSFDQAAVEAVRSEKGLEALQGVAKSLTIRYVGHAHMDMNWLWSWPDTVKMVSNTFNTVDRLMDEFPAFKFSQSQTAIYEIVRRFNPDLFTRIRDRVREGRWEITANQWVEGDKNLASDESIIRHILYSKEFFHHHWNIPRDSVKVVFEPDTFGHPMSLPTIYHAAGIRWLYFCRGGPGPTAFLWRAPGGSEIVAWNDFQQWYNGSVTGEEVQAALQLYQDTGITSFLKVYGVGDHGGGPTRVDIRRILTMQKWPLFPTMQFAHLADHFMALEKDCAELRVVRHELNDVFPGCYSSKSDVKSVNTEHEAGLRNAEGLEAMAILLGVAGPQDTQTLQEMWQDTLFGQFHDILSGSGVPETYQYTLGKAQDIQAGIQMTCEQSMATIAEAIDTRDPQENVVPVVVFNPLAWARHTTVEMDIYEHFDPGTPVQIVDDQGHPIMAQFYYDSYLGFPAHRRIHLIFDARVGGLGYRTYFVRPGISAQGGDPHFLVETRAEGHHALSLAGQSLAMRGMASTPDQWTTDSLPPDLRLFRQQGRSTYQQGFVVKSAWWHVEVRSGQSGIIIHRPERPVSSAVEVGSLKWFNEEPHAMSAWEIGADRERFSVKGTRWKIVEVGPVRIVLEAETSVGSSSQINTSVILYATSPRIDWLVAVDWREFGTPTHGVPGLSIHFAVPQNATYARFGQSMGSVSRPIPSRDVPSQGWTAVGEEDDGAVIYHPQNYGVSVTPGDVFVTLLRASYDPDPYAEIGHHTFRISYAPGTIIGSDKWTRQSCEFLSPLIGWDTTTHSGMLPVNTEQLALKSSAGVITAVKPALDGHGIVIRIRQDDNERQQLRLKTSPAIQTITACSVLETNLSDQTPAGVEDIEVTVPAHGLATFRLQSSGKP